MTKQLLVQKITELEKTIAFQRTQISDLSKELQCSYDENQTVSRVEYDKLLEEASFFKNQTQLLIESNKKELKRERLRHDSLIEYYEAQTTELQALKAGADHSRKHNERGAGRKTKITPIVSQLVREMRDSGNTYLEIAAALELSVGTVHKAFRS